MSSAYVDPPLWQGTTPTNNQGISQSTAEQMEWFPTQADPSAPSQRWWTEGAFLAIKNHSRRADPLSEASFLHSGRRSAAKVVHASYLPCISNEHLGDESWPPPCSNSHRHHTNSGAARDSKRRDRTDSPGSPLRRRLQQFRVSRPMTPPTQPGYEIEDWTKTSGDLLRPPCTFGKSTPLPPPPSTPLPPLQRLVEQAHQSTQNQKGTPLSFASTFCGDDDSYGFFVDLDDDGDLDPSRAAGPDVRPNYIGKWVAIHA